MIVIKLVRIPGKVVGYPLLQLLSWCCEEFDFADMNTQFQKRRTVVLLGDKGVGKTSLVKTLQQLAKATPTAGPSDIHEVTYKGTKIVMVDVAGDSHTTITPNTIRHAKIVLLAYDITNHETLDSCKYWHQFAQQNVNSRENTISYALVGCKSDLSDHERQVAWDTAERVSKMINASKVFEVSNATKDAQCIQLIDWVYGIIKEAAVQDDQVNDGSVALGNATQVTNNQPERKCWC